MGFRVPVLEYFSWQPMVLGINIKSLSEVQAKKGNRYIVSDVPNEDELLLKDHSNCIMYYGDNDKWFFDKPEDAWTVTYKEHIQKIDKITGEVILDENNNPVYIDLFHILCYSEFEHKWKDWSSMFSNFQRNYDNELGCFLVDPNI